jgi:uncharacterized protein YbaR (Trm112 family)
MRSEVLEILQCPNCRRSDWRLKSLKQDGREIRQGSVVCLVLPQCLSHKQRNSGSSGWVPFPDNHRSKISAVNKWRTGQLCPTDRTVAARAVAGLPLSLSARKMK